MKNYLLLAASMCLMVGCGSGQKVSQPEKYSQRMVESHGLVDFYCNRHHQAELDSASWDYVSGLVANAVLKAWTLYPEKTEYYDAVKAFADNSTTPDGSVILNAKGESALRPSNIDDLPAGNVFFTLYKEELKKGNTKDANRYKNAASLIRNKLKYDHSRIPEGLPGAGGFSTRLYIPIRCGLMGYIWVLRFMLSGNMCSDKMMLRTMHRVGLTLLYNSRLSINIRMTKASS